MIWNRKSKWVRILDMPTRKTIQIHTGKERAINKCQNKKIEKICILLKNPCLFL